MSNCTPNPAPEINFPLQFPKQSKPYPDHLSAVDASISAMLDQLISEPNAEVEEHLASYLLGHVLYLMGKRRGITQPTECIRFLAGVLMSQANSIEYDDYLKTEHWRVTRMAALDRAEHRCQLCHSEDRLEVHHASYERIWHERPGDLTVLCRGCHARFHGVTP